MSPSKHLTSRPAYFVYGVIVIVAAVIVGAVFVSPLLSTERQFADYNVDNDKVAIHVPQDHRSGLRGSGASLA